ncbi:MAG TPA: DUF4386 domain-containing protein [Acidimicrobiia bacterium]|nr:DUF4386 domain-containing protein [Acidimicrobiia bacterium]
MSSSVIVEIPRRRLARITGGLYLAFILAMALADVFGHIGIGDVELAYQALTTDSSQFAAGLGFGLLSAFLFVMAAWGLYVLLRPVNRDLALLFLLLNAIGVAIQVASYLPLIFGMLSTDASGFKGAFSLAQIEGLQFLSLDLHKVGFATAQLFFGTWLFPLGYLVYKSGFLPKSLGVLLILDGFAVLLWFFQAILLPDYPAMSSPGLALSFVAEVGLGLWLLFRGINVTADAPGLPEPPRRVQHG